MDDDRERFLAERRAGIGGSDVGAILGVNPHKSAFRVWQEKVGEVLPEPETPEMTRGREMEPYIADWYAKQTGRAVARGVKHYTHPEHPELAVHVDGLLFDATKGTGIAEFKAPGIRNYGVWKLAGLPVAHFVQIQHGIGVLPPHLAQYGGAVFFSAEAWSGVHFDVQPDWDLIAEIQERSLKFWRDHVLTRKPPEEPEPVEIKLPPIEASETSLLVTRDDPEWGQAVAALFEARTLYEDADTYRQAVEERVKELMGDSQIVQGGGARIYWKWAKGRANLDESRLKAYQPLDPTKAFAVLADIAATLDPTEERAGALIRYIQERLAGEARLDFSEFQKITKASRPFKVYKTP